jgi:threonyl-tRNA synthetase
VFLAEADVEPEVSRFCTSLHDFYRALGFSDIAVHFATRPAQRAGSDEVWDRAERALENAARRAGLGCQHKPGAGAFYGPKLEFELKDRLGRAWQCGTIQLDFVLPERFELSYDDSAGKRAQPAMLHRAMLGSLERFLGILLEHYAAGCRRGSRRSKCGFCRCTPSNAATREKSSSDSLNAASAPAPTRVTKLWRAASRKHTRWAYHSFG